jgi:hypothetical protein
MEDGDVRSVKSSAAPQVVEVHASLGHGPVLEIMNVHRPTTSGTPCLEILPNSYEQPSEFMILTMEDLPELQEHRPSTSLGEVEERNTRLVIAVDFGTTYAGMPRN